MKKIGILLGVLILAVGWNVWSRRHIAPIEQTKTDATAATSTQAGAHPLSMEEMRARSYDGGTIQTVRTARQTEKFVSTVVTYTSDGLKQYALVNTPKGKVPDGGWPVVIVNHGHIAPSVYSTEQSYINTSAYFANAGFLVIKPDYRGHDKSEGVADTLISRIEYAIDVLNLMASVHTLPNINSERIFMYGHSMGGDVTLRVLEVSDKVKAATLWAPAVTTFPESVYYFRRKRLLDEPRMAMVEKEFETLTKNQPAEDFSPIAHIAEVGVPVLIHQGTADESVPYQWGVDLNEALKKAGKSVTFYSYANDNHDIARNWGTALARDVEFFKRY